MKHLAIAVVALLIGTSASAEVCTWKDKDGKTVFSDKPPTGAVTNSNCSGRSTSAATAPKTVAEKDLDFKKRQKDSQDKAAKDEKEQTAAADKKANCDKARQYLRTLESGERIGLRDDKGERYFMEDAQREQETGKTREFVKSNCEQ